jgi:GT2 family glycosyltransferase
MVTSLKNNDKKNRHITLIMYNDQAPDYLSYSGKIVEEWLEKGLIQQWMIACVDTGDLKRCERCIGKRAEKCILTNYNKQAEALNRIGIALETDLTLFISSDIKPNSEALHALRDVIDCHPEVGVVGSLLIHPDPHILHAGFLINQYGYPYTYRRRELLVGNELKSAYVDGVSWFFMLVRSSLFKALHGFSEAYDHFWADLDFCRRAVMLGQKTWLCTESVVEHYEIDLIERLQSLDADTETFMRRSYLYDPHHPIWEEKDKLKSWAIELQKEPSERSAMIGNLHEQLAEQSIIVEKQSDELAEKKARIRSVEQEAFNVNEQNTEKTGELLDRLSGIEVELQNKQGHIEQLLEQERLLNNILDSRGWRLLQRGYHLKNTVLPSGSHRRLLAKLVYKAITNPRIFFGSINTSNIRKFFYYLKTEDVSRVENKIDNYLIEHTESKGLELQLFKPTESKQKISFIKHDNPLVSIIIPVYNQWEYTYFCLKSILENTNGIAYEIIIADDVSTDETVNILDYVENIIVVRNQENKGFLLNCNNAATYVRGKYILFLNNDTNVQRDWLPHLVNLIEHDDTIGLVGSKLVYADGRLQEAGGIIWKDASGWNYGHFDDPDKPEYNYVKEVDYISGAAIMIKNDLWREIGGFDERYAPAYFEDADLAFEVRKKNYKVVYQPKSVVVHFEGVSHGTDDNAGIKNYQVKNREKFIEKWKDELEKNQLENGQDVFWARDRSKGKKTILFIDHYVPHYDKDAGSRTTFQYLKLFVEMGFNVKFVGDNFFRHEPYTSMIEELGIEVFYGNWYMKNIERWLKANGRYIQFAFLNRPHITVKYIDAIKKYTESKIIYYGHDLHHLREYREYLLSENEETLRSSKRWKEIEYEIIKKSHVAYYPSIVEVEEIKKDLPLSNVKAIPAYIYNIDETSDFNNSIEDRKDIMFIGGFTHKPNVDAVIWFVTKIWPKVLEKIPELKFIVIGSNPPDEIKQLQTDNIILTGHVTDDEMKEYYRKCRLAIVPLRYGAGVKGKIVEAMYYKTPVITTNIGVEGLPDIEGNLIVADGEVEFAEQIVINYKNINYLEELIFNGCEYIKKHFSKNAVEDAIAKDIEV